MSMNSSTSDGSLSSISSFLPLGLACLISRPNSFIFISFSITNIIILLPLCILILYHGLHHQWEKYSTSSETKVNHSDSFTYHMVIMELIGLFGCTLISLSIYLEDLIILLLGGLLYFFIWYGETFFHVLTCIERYLAVVHPITYMSLKKERGIRMRNISIGCVWVLCIIGVGLTVREDIFIIMHFCFHISAVIIISFSSLSVLCVLVHPGPGEQAGKKEKVDQSKLRAFYTIVAILGVLVLKCVSSVVWAVVSTSEGGNCLMTSVSIWLNITCSLMLPLLFLHRKGKLVCSKNTKRR